MEEIERRTIRVWMRQVMQEHGLSANAWAMKAGTSPTNITRFLNSDSKFIPSARTLAKLAKVVRSSPQFLNASKQERIKIPVMDANGQVDHMIVVDRDDVVAYKLKEYTGMGSMGIMSHSTVIVEPRNTWNDIEENDIVCVCSPSYEILCGRYNNGLINYYPSSNAVPPEFDPQNWMSVPTDYIGDEGLYGKVIQSIINF